MKKIVLLAVLFVSSGAYAMTVDERLTALEEAVNKIISDEKPRNEKINEISNNVLLLQKSLEDNKK